MPGIPAGAHEVNGIDTLITRADVMFRAVPVTPGDSEVVFTYAPGWLPGALIVWPDCLADGGRRDSCVMVATNVGK